MPDIVLLCRFVGGRGPDVAGQTGLLLNHMTEDGQPEITCAYLTVAYSGAYHLTPGTLCQTYTQITYLELYFYTW